MPQFLKYILTILVIAAGYYISGRMGLFFTIPPGQATAIWPASGIALAALILQGYRYWPAIFIGAMGTSLYHPDVIDLQALGIAGCIAMGASLQALAGAWAVRKCLAHPLLLERTIDVIKLLILGGVFSCLINASIGTFTLYHVGFVEYKDLLPHWYTWWIGDILGVIVFTPTFLLLCAPRGQDNASVGIGRRLSVTISVLTVFLAVTFLFFVTKQKNKIEHQKSFQNQAADISYQFRKELQQSFNTLSSIDSFFNASQFVSLDEFKIFTESFLDISPGISGLSWVPKVTDAERAAFENDMRKQGFPDFEIKHRYAEGELGTAQKRDVYFPITYTEPYEVNKKAHGFDVYGPDLEKNNVRTVPLNTARDTGYPQATARFSIVQNEGEYGFIIYHPLYKKNAALNTTQDYRENLIGYFNGIFLLPSLMANTEGLSKKQNMDVVLKDLNENQERQILYDSRTENHQQGDASLYQMSDTTVMYMDKIDMAGRHWELCLIEKEHLLSKYSNWELWYVITGGTFFTGLVGMFMLVVTARTAVTERLVNKRTAALKEAQNFQDLVMDSIPDLIFVKDENFRIIQANPPFLSVYPEDQRDKVIGYTTLEKYNKEEADLFLTQDRIALKEGYSEVEETITFPNGNIRTLSTKKVRFTDADGHKYILGISRDVTTLKDAERALLETNAEMEEFAYMTSHDLRSPLISSIGLLDLSLTMLEKNNIKDVKESITHTKTSLDKLRNLIDDILELTLIKNKEVEPQEIDLDSLIKSSIEKLSHMDGYEDISIQTRLRHKKRVVTDLLRFSLIVENLLSNAIKYHDPDEKTSMIRITSHDEDNHFVLYVEDNGLGIPEGQQENLFKIFKRFHPKISYGSGLGLHLMRKSADKINAEILFEAPEKGARFLLRLPYS